MKKSKFEELQAEQLHERLITTHVEVEQKYRAEDPHAIRKALSKLGAKRVKVGYEHNELFDIGKTFRKRKQIVRLRFHGDYGAWLTLKGKRLKGEHKRRLEIETPVHFESMRRILVAMGFRVSASYGKNREEFKWQDATICLDHLPSCGWFVEIEGLPKAIKSIAEKLGLEDKHKEERSYRKLLREQSISV